MTSVITWPLTGRDSELAQVLELQGDSAIDGVLIAGPAGIGKTRLALEAGERCSRQGRRVRVLRATEAAATVPFACFAAGLAGQTETQTGSTEPAQIAIRELLRDVPTGDRLVAVVDDAPHLDGPTTAVLHQLMVAGRCFLIATRRVEDSAPESASVLWRSGEVRRLDLAPIGERAFDELVTNALEGPVEPLTRRRLQRLSQGNPLLLREILNASVQSGVLRLETAGWELVGDFQASSSLKELVSYRLSSLRPSAMAALELVALANPLDMRLIDAEERSALEEIEQMGLAFVESSRGRQLIAPAHPMYGEIVREQMPRLRRMRLSRRLAQAMDKLSDADDYVLERGVLWLAADESPAGPLLEQAAERASLVGDHNLALRFADAAVPSFQSALAAGQSAAALGNLPEARRWFATAEKHAENEDQTIQATIALSRVLFFFAAQFDEAHRILSEARNTCRNIRSLALLETAAAEYLGFHGRWESARAQARAILELGLPEPEVLFSAHIVHAISAVFSGPWADVDPSITEALQNIDRVNRVAPSQDMWIRLARSWSLLVDGHIRESLSQYRENHYAALDGLISTDYAPWWAMGYGIAATAVGSITEETLQMTQDGLAMMRRWPDIADILSFGVSVLSLTHAMAGNLASAQALLDEYDNHFRPIEHKTTFLADRAAAWIVANEGDRDGAVSLALHAADVALHADAPLWALSAYHDVVRFGIPSAAIIPLQIVVDRLGGNVPSLILSHTKASISNDGAALEQSSRDFERMGAVELAAEALVQAADVGGYDGADREKLLTRARGLAATSIATSPLLRRLASAEAT